MISVSLSHSWLFLTNNHWITKSLPMSLLSSSLYLSACWSYHVSSSIWSILKNCLYDSSQWQGCLLSCSGQMKTFFFATAILNRNATGNHQQMLLKWSETSDPFVIVTDNTYVGPAQCNAEVGPEPHRTGGDWASVVIFKLFFVIQFEKLTMNCVCPTCPLSFKGGDYLLL